MNKKRGNQMSIEIKKGDQITAFWGAGIPEQQGKISKINEDGSYISKIPANYVIDDKFINFKFRKRVMDICRDWYELNKSKAQLPL